MQDHYYSPSSLVHQFITPPHVSTVVGHGRVSTLTGCVTATSPLRRPVTDLHHGRVLSKEGLGQARITLRPGQWRKCYTLSPCPAQEWRGDSREGSRLKIATDVAGVLGYSKPQQEQAALPFRRSVTLLVVERELDSLTLDGLWVRLNELMTKPATSIDRFL
jgi:hypothetical protein